MHAVVYQVDMKEGHEDEAQSGLDNVIAATKVVPGFVRGTWVTDGRLGISMIVMQSEDAARQMAADSTVDPEAPVTFRAVDVYEVVGEA